MPLEPAGTSASTSEQAPSEAAASVDLFEDLKKLKELRDLGAITLEQFEATQKALVAAIQRRY